MTMLSAPSAHGDDRDNLQHAAAALSVTMAGVADGTRAAAAPDGLDFLAVLAGIKPVCIVGQGISADDWVDAIRDVAARAGLPTIAASFWAADDSAAPLPPWYVAATARRQARQSSLYVCRDEAIRDAVAAVSAKGRVAPDEEAALLGYPRCCVAAHHQRALALEHLVAELTERIAKGDAAQMTRMIEAGAAPLPRTPDDWRRYETAAAVTFAPFTSIAMCAPCAADRDSPARELSRRYRALAARARYQVR